MHTSASQVTKIINLPAIGWRDGRQANGPWLIVLESEYSTGSKFVTLE